MIFPFPAKCDVAKMVSPLVEGEGVEVRSMAPQDACGSDSELHLNQHYTYPYGLCEVHMQEEHIADRVEDTIRARERGECTTVE